MPGINAVNTVTQISHPNSPVVTVPAPPASVPLWKSKFENLELQADSLEKEEMDKLLPQVRALLVEHPEMMNDYKVTVSFLRGSLSDFKILFIETQEAFLHKSIKDGTSSISNLIDHVYSRS
ncbi:MAG: hypothetical protein WCK49_07065 [Myxococcaceae bacterium]